MYARPFSLSRDFGASQAGIEEGTPEDNPHKDMLLRSRESLSLHIAFNLAPSSIALLIRLLQTKRRRVERCK